MIVTYDANKLRKDLVTYMDNAGLTYREFSKLSGVDAAIISKFVSGKYIPKIETKSMQRVLIRIGKTMSDYKLDAYDMHEIETVSRKKSVNMVDKCRALTVEELNEHIDKVYIYLECVKKIREEKIQIELNELHAKTKYYEGILKEESLE